MARSKSNLQSELVALQALAADQSMILAWPARGIGVAFDGAGNPMTTNLAKAVPVTAKNQHRLVADGSRVNASLVKRSDAIATFLPTLEKEIATATDAPATVATTMQKGDRPNSRPTSAVTAPEATGTHGA